MNVIVSDKQRHLQYVDLDAAIAHCTKGLGIWEWASTDKGYEPNVVLVGCGDIPKQEALAADGLLVNLTVHTNFTPVGRKAPDFLGGIIPNDPVNGAAEWAYGVTDWFEQGLYLPVYSFYSERRGGSINGFKLRELFVRPHAADHTFVYRVSFEFSANERYWDPKGLLPKLGLSLVCTCIRG